MFVNSAIVVFGTYGVNSEDTGNDLNKFVLTFYQEKICKLSIFVTANFQNL